MAGIAASIRMRQVVDWRAAFWAGLAAGTVFLLVNLFGGGKPLKVKPLLRCFRR
jgi:hypothetical protein